MRLVHCRPEGSADPAGLPETAEIVAADSPADGLEREAERVGAHMIVLGSTHRGALGRVWPGAVAEKLLQGAPCPVAVAPAGFAGGDADALRMIAVAFDGSSGSRAAVDEAVLLGQAAGAGLKVISVAPPGSYDPRDDLAELVRGLPHELRADPRFHNGMPVTEIVAESEVGVDLLVMGSRRSGPARRVLLGSVSSDVVRSAACPVVVVPQ
jgi:nucleotide-binding universal stress UspA family protein